MVMVQVEKASIFNSKTIFVCENDREKEREKERARLDTVIDCVMFDQL